MKKNIKLREFINQSGVYLWQIAEALGISDTTFSKRLRKELSDEEKQKIYDAVQRIKMEE